jgi:hypothetical protein
VTVYKHLGKALDIQIKESDWRKWLPLIEALTPEEQAEVRPYLRMQARIAQGRAQVTNTSALSSSPVSKSRRTR